jgi:hypothetical protein
MGGTLVLDVVAPDGEHLISKEFPIENLDPRITIKVDAKTCPKILKNEDPVLGNLVKMTGRVIDTQGRQVSNRQVSLWVIPFLEEVDNGDQYPQLLLVTFSDKHGYFLGAYPKGKYSEAYGIICNDKREKMLYSLHKITFIRNIILDTITHIDYGKHFIICCTGLFPTKLTKSWNNYVG